MSALFSRFDPAEHLETEAHIVAYLQAAQETNDPVLLAAALGDIARARQLQASINSTGLEGPDDRANT